MSEVVQEFNTMPSLGKDITRKSALRIMKQFVEQEENEELGQKLTTKILTNSSKRKQSEEEKTSFRKLSIAQKREMIIKKFLNSQKNKDVFQYSEEALNRKYEKFRDFILARNSLIGAENQAQKRIYGITEDDVLDMIYNSEIILKSGLSTKIKDNTELLDSYPGIGYRNTNLILKGSTIPIRHSTARLQLQLKIAEENGLIPMLIRVPHLFILSPRTMYALIEYRKSKLILDGLAENEEHAVQIVSTMERSKLFPSEKTLSGNISYEDLRMMYDLESSKFSKTPELTQYKREESSRERDEEEI